MTGAISACTKTSAPSKGYEAKKSIIIIGAGIAGLAAAKHLIKHEFDITILEARDRIGGRIHTGKKWDSEPIDLGATWIHGIDQNPISKLADELRLIRISTDYDASIIYDSDGRPLSKTNEIILDRMREEFSDAIEKAQALDKDQSISDIIAKICVNKSDIERRYINFLVSSEIEQEYSGDRSEISAHWFDNTKEFDGDDELFTNGYSQIIQYLAKDCNIEINQIVKSVNWNDLKIKIGTQDKTYLCDGVIITVPLGVLKSNSIQFMPPLPPTKQKAIGKLGMGLLNKCYLKFEKTFWPEDIDWLEFISDSEGSWSEWVSFTNAARWPILLGFNSGKSALELEKLSDKDTVNSAMFVLRQIFGEKIPDPIDYQITRWGADRFSLGSYSFNSVGSVPVDRKTLAKSIDNRIYFAGEATSLEYFSTVHGAYLSGLEAAKEITG